MKERIKKSLLPIAGSNLKVLDNPKSVEKKKKDKFIRFVDSLKNINQLVAQDSTVVNQISNLTVDLVGATSPLGLGWTDAEWEALKKGTFKDWFLKLIGMILTTLAISLGAPFWFDILKQIINIRNAGTLNTASQ